MAVAIVFGLIACPIIDMFGIRASINIGVWLNFAGAFIRVFSSFNSKSELKLINSSAISSTASYYVLLVGQIVCAIGQPFLMFVTTKFATSWFAENQRGLANTIALASSVFGTLIGASVSPMFVTDDYLANKIVKLNEFNLVLIILAVISFVPAAQSLFIRRSLPELAPSLSSAEAGKYRKELTLNRANLVRSMKDTVKEMKSLLKNLHFMILFICFGVGVGIFNALTTLIEQIFCIRGYKNIGKFIIKVKIFIEITSYRNNQ
jgi:FLVCR family MFS transporter 7